MPEQACLVVAHPLLYHTSFNFFFQTVVLICRHSLASGTYGLTLNRLMSSEAKAIMNNITAASSLTPDRQPAWTQPQANLDLSRDLPAVLQALMGKQSLRGHTDA